MESDGSPYQGKASVSYEEFLWASNTVSARHVCLHEHEVEKDANLLLMMLPLLDLLNHSNEPNVGLMPMYDQFEDRSFLILKALRDIEANE